MLDRRAGVSAIAMRQDDLLDGEDADDAEESEAEDDEAGTAENSEVTLKTFKLSARGDEY